MPELGFAGLGAMGAGIVRRLLEAGHTVTGWNRTPARAAPLLEAGMLWAASPRELAERCEIVFSMVTDSAALAAITGGEDGILAGLGPGKVYIDMTTGAPARVRELAAAVAQRGAHMLEAPVSGSIATLEQGRLLVMVGGEEEVFERVRPVLEALGRRVIHVGGSGAATTMKIASNLSLAVQMLAFSEGVLLAEKAGGVARERAVEVMLNSAIASPMIVYRGPFVLDQPQEAWFDVSMMKKDLGLALELGREFDVPLPSTAVTNELLTAARAMGLGRHDFSIVFEVLAAMSGVDGDGGAAPDGG